VTRDQFAAMCEHLLGRAMPLPPYMPGRRHALVDDGDAPDDLAGLRPVDVARITGLTRQAASLRVKAARTSGRWDLLLAPKFSNHRPTAAPAGAGADHLAGEGNLG
jgi:hypothetical protein